MEIICRLLQFYIYAIWARVLLSWVRTSPDGFIGKVSGVVDLVTDPVMMPLRKIIPPLRLGGAALDLSPIIVLFGVQYLLRAIC